MKILLGLLLLFLGSTIPCVAQIEQDVVLNPSFEIHRLPDFFDGKASLHASCSASLAPVMGVEGNTFYTDSNHSVVNRELFESDLKAAEPLTRFVTLLNSYSNEYLLSSGDDHKSAQCAMAELQRWASVDALSGPFNQQGKYHLKWAVPAISAAYLLMRNDPSIDQSDNASIGEWIGRLGWSVQKDYASFSPNSNHLYWAAAAAISAGVASNDNVLFIWGVNAAKAGLQTVDADGVLPSEAKRGEKAFNYHVFSLLALTLCAEYAAANNVDIYSFSDGALKRLANFVMHNFQSPENLAMIFKVEQSWAGPEAWSLAWAEPYFARFHDPRLLAQLKEKRPIIYRMYGGNATLEYGVDLNQ